ncbi:MAG: flagellar hook-basal body complex protein, partial [Oscillospiraceae bacterium]|nr:flagellar hook-basal body complex protein [Oscillospiraceae bacterium]
ANVNITFVSSASLPIGQKMTAKISGASIVVTVNANEEFSDIDEINAEMNKAIKSANGGVEHPAGEFTIDMVPSDSKFSTVDIDGVTTQPIKLKGSEIVGTNFGYIAGEVTMPGDLRGLFGVESVSEGFTGDTRSSKFPIQVSNSTPTIDYDDVEVQFTDSNNTQHTVTINKSQLNLTGKIVSVSVDASGTGVDVTDDQGKTDTISSATLLTGLSGVTVSKIDSQLIVNPKGLYIDINSTWGNGTAHYTMSEISGLAGLNNVSTISVSNGKISVDDGNGTNKTIEVQSDGTISVTDGNGTNKTISANSLITKAGLSDNKSQDFVVSYDSATGLTITMKDYKVDSNGNDISTTYVGTVSPEQLKSAGSVVMYAQGGTSDDSFVISYPSITTLKSTLPDIAIKNSGVIYTPAAGGDGFTFTFPSAVNMKQSEPSRSLGLGQSSFKLSGGTEGGEQTVANLTSISINDDGCLVGTHEIYGVVELGRIDLATFANPAGLAKVGNTYFETTLNSGDPIVVNAGTEGTGQLMASTLEASNVDLSNEFSDMIMTQRGFQASSRVITVSDTMLEELINLKR